MMPLVCLESHTVSVSEAAENGLDVVSRYKEEGAGSEVSHASQVPGIFMQESVRASPFRRGTRRVPMFPSLLIRSNFYEVSPQRKYSQGLRQL